MGLSIRNMAVLLGVSKSQVARDKDAGMPMHDVDAARAWRLATHDLSRTAEGRIDRPARDVETLAAPPPPSPPDDDSSDGGTPEDTAKFRRARADREQTNAETARIELEQLRGTVINLQEAVRITFTAWRSLRDAVMNVAPRTKDQLAAMTDAMAIEQLLEAELAGALGSLNPEQVLNDSDADDDEPG
jgi:hypothetical protein